MSAPAYPSPDQVLRWLSEITDPEIPVLTLADLEIIRGVAWEQDTLVVKVTPTYSGCPATTMINLDIEQALRARGVQELRLERQLSPPWTTDWISAEGRRKLRDYEIAPPVDRFAAEEQIALLTQRLADARPLAIACPRCGSEQTERLSQFGSTPCKASYRCTACLEPFELFKCI